jgi:hypothetical protein
VAVLTATALTSDRGWPGGKGRARTRGPAGGSTRASTSVSANLGYEPCGSGPGFRLRGTGEMSCGGLDPLPWAVVGIALVLMSILTYRLARRAAIRNSSSGDTPHRS